MLEVNCFEARTPSGSMVLCLYPQTSVLAHDCVPNVVHTITPTNGKGERYRYYTISLVWERVTRVTIITSPCGLR